MILKAQLVLKSYSKETLFLYIKYLKAIASKINLNFSTFNLPKRRKVITLLKSPHVNKKAKEQFEIKYFKTVIFFKDGINLQIIKSILANRPKSISLKIKI